MRRTWAGPLVVATLASATLLLAGCASGTSGSPTVTAPGTAPAGAPASPSTTATIVPAPDGSVVPGELTVEVDATGSGAVETWTLTCDPVGGSHPDPLGACLALGTPEGVAALAPVPASTMCTEIWGGPQTAHVTGTLDGEPVDATFSRTDGCQIARWDTLVAVLGTGGA
ncbi:SSI family serine proteinase inhibitor [Cellulomonas soli]|uniref:Subtilisin inhibitor domain-containing protein n=1 Tax=Cellulomonas soli TaxID=931535 RepID=A0A512PHR2_9CELL|nr:SSI family serine proteinase inhibitor [Cellulomonas soli]NYI59221.1 hypothetical protein [Cellulomonas soli]GEP70727.1 hypothetical protein CSO01_34420 [Cellulomonas soli]